MLVSHDPGEGVCYIQLSTASVARTQVIESLHGWVNLDLDNEGNVVGVEVVT